ncbi:phage virion morphogenesis protein [bacterium]|nr:phage virion morphogenesis protein [bacterium]
MTTLRITEQSQALAALRAAIQQIKNTRPLMAAIGSSMVESTQQRFSSATAPDGSAWAPNSEVTINRYLKRFKSSFKKKRGGRSAAGERRAGAKKPLTGKSKSLRTRINYKLDNGGVSIGSPMIYAATQQFGAKKGSFGKRTPWGDIPARRFLGLSNADEQEISDLTADFLAQPFE